MGYRKEGLAVDILLGPAKWIGIGILIGCWFMSRVLPFVLRCYHSFSKRCFASQKKEDARDTGAQRKVEKITDAELRSFVDELDERGGTTNIAWEFAIQKSCPTVSYFAKRRDPEGGGPTQILSTTVFENCSSKLARDFYMDGNFRKRWDSTFVLQEQLDLCVETGTEVGRIVKKFPLFTPKEYVLVWRVWEGEDDTFYCFSKACEHELAPRKEKLKRVKTYYSGWRIRKVVGREACEINMIHQEDLCVHRDMGKMAFSRGIWSYVRKMDTNLRKFSVLEDNSVGQDRSALSFIQKVPVGLLSSVASCSSSSEAAGNLSVCDREMSSNGGSERKNSTVGEAALRKRFAKGLLLVGGALFFSQSSASWGAKIAAACLVRRFVKPQLRAGQLKIRRRDG